MPRSVSRPHLVGQDGKRPRGEEVYADDSMTDMHRADTMSSVSSLVPVVGSLLLAAGLMGCQSLQTLGLGPPRDAAPASGATDRFMLPPPGDNVVGELRVTLARRDDTLSDIARRFDLGYEEIVAANPGVDPWLPGEGRRIVLPTQFILLPGPRKGLVLNLASMRLFYYYPQRGPMEPAMVITHPMGIGREGWATPVGDTRVVSKTEKPSWVVPASVRAEHAREGAPLPGVVPPGPDNPLGDYALRLALPSYLIHGTNKPYGVGMQVSHGCIRLYPEDIASLFPLVPVGTPVRIVNLPYVAGRRDGALYLESHPPLEEQAKRREGSMRPMRAAVTKAAGKSPRVDWDKARRVAREARGFPVPISPGSPRVEALLLKAPVVRDPPARMVAGGSEHAPRGRWYVQVGSYRRADNARKTAALLGHLGPSVPTRTLDADGKFRVVAGPYPTKAAARADENRIRQVLGAETIILEQPDSRLD